MSKEDVDMKDVDDETSKPDDLDLDVDVNDMLGTTEQPTETDEQILIPPALERKDKSLKEFLNSMDEYAPIVSLIPCMFFCFL